MNYKVKQLITDLKSLFAGAKSAREQVSQLSLNINDIAGTFAQVNFSEAAALSNAILFIGVDEDFLENEMEKVSAAEIEALAKQNVERLTDTMLAKISLKMTESNIQEINGIKKALEIWRKCA